MVRILAVGDPHFKVGNERDTNLLQEEVLRCIAEEKIDDVVIMGDTLHRHEKIDLGPFVRATEFLHKIQSTGVGLYVLIGNHDYASNREFMTQNHAFNSFKLWDNTVIVDRTYVEEIGGVKLVLVPYVPTGRLDEALRDAYSIKYDGSEEKIDASDLEGVSLVFAHQEFKGCKMNTITSEEGDPWPLDRPLCISGHIHDYDDLQPNLIYTGTPMQHGYGDLTKKSLSIITVEPGSPPCHTRWWCRYNKKVSITLTVDEFLKYTPPEDTDVRIKLRGHSVDIKKAISLPQVSHITNNPRVKVVLVNTDKHQELGQAVSNIRARVPFDVRLRDAINKESPNVKTTFDFVYSS